MFERLRKLRGELERMTPRYVEITTKYEDLKSKIHEEEVTEVIGIVDKVGMTPEQLAEYLGVKDDKKPVASSCKKKSSSVKVQKEVSGDDSKNTGGDRSFDSKTDEDQNTTNVGMEDILNESY